MDATNLGFTDNLRQPRTRPGAPSFGPVEQQMLAALQELRRGLGREPTPDEIGRRMGLRASEVRKRLDRVQSIELPDQLKPQQEACLRAIIALQERLGRSPSRREISAEMGMSEAGSQRHIEALVRMGLLTPPRMVLVLSVTPAGKAYLKPKG